MSEHLLFHYPRVEIDGKNKIVTFDKISSSNFLINYELKLIFLLLLLLMS
jgi:hypothetical protein